MSQEDEPTGATGQEPVAGQEPKKQEPAKAAEPEKFDADYVKQLRDEAAANRTAKRDLEVRLKEIEDRDKSESQKLTDRATEAENKAKDLEQRILRVDVAEKKGLTLAQARRLIGEDKDELLKDADRLLQELGSGPAAGGFDGGARRGASGPQSMDDMIRAAAGH